MKISATALVCFLLIGELVNAQSISANKFINAYRLSPGESIEIDGKLSDDVWMKVEPVNGFIQRFPLDGQNATEKTDVKLAYSTNHVFVSFRAYDSSPDSIAATLFRRDGSEFSDWVYVSFDSYNDKRTAFTFAVNPRGVQKDILYHNDVEEDIRWDAVWDASTSIDEEGWTAEIRIPLSQLRYSSANTEQNWGVNFQRRIARKEEISFWSRTPREENGLVSFFGSLNGIRDLEEPMRLEILPYILGSDTREPQPENINGDESPFFEENDFQFKAGGDIKYGISSDFTFTGTINPDFGQVEADPATINLSEFEVFFEERRPFFLEGADIFNYGSTNSQNTFRTHQNFYSRRIGRSPVGSLSDIGIDPSNTFEDRSTQATIAGAGKVSGKTSNGLSVGILNAYTLEESSNFFITTNDSSGSYTTEPASNYFVSRIKQDINQGDAFIGGFAGAVNRNLNGGYLENYLHESAYQGGIDGGYSWDNRNWGVYGSLSGSLVNGSEEALLRTQTTSARYYDRVDSDYLSVDSSKTSLSGYSAEISVGRFGGAGLKYSLTYSETSPGYEINDLGFQERADYRSPHFYLEYLGLNSDMFRFYLLWGYGGYAWNFDGDLIMNFYAGGAYFQFNNLWTLTYTGGFTGTFYNDRIARGGPVMRRPKSWNSRISLESNSTKELYASIGGSYRADASGEYTTTLFGALNYRPTGFLQLSVAPTFLTELNTDQYIGFFDSNGDNSADYTFSKSRLDIFYTEFRLNWTFTPTLSLQTYARPLFYTADFSDFKTFSERKTYNFDRLNPATQTVFDSFFDFDYRILQGNAVLRWEYRPGSTLFFVWQQEKEQTLGGQSQFDPFKNTDELFNTDPINIFLVKLSFWFGN